MNRLRGRTSTTVEVGTIVIVSAGYAELHDRLRTSVALGASNVVVDLGQTEMVDSATLASLKRLSEHLRGKGGRLAVVCLHPRLANLLDLTLLNRSFAVFRTLDAALLHAAS
jgi:anti-anti-sigma factor